MKKKKYMCVKRDCMHSFYVDTEKKCCGIKCPKCGSKGSSINMSTGKPVY